MIRIITAARLRTLEATVIAREAVLHTMALDLAVARQALLLSQREAGKWEARASRFIDQIGIAEGKIASPAMNEPAATPRSEVRGIFAALGKKELSRPVEDVTAGTGYTAPASTGGFLGVDDHAAQAAIADVLHSVS